MKNRSHLVYIASYVRTLVDGVTPIRVSFIAAPAFLSSDAVTVDDAREELVQELRTHVGRQIGPIAKPRQVLVVDELPKTRSGKIMRRLLKDVAEGREAGDATTLADPSVMAQIQEGLKK